MEESPQAGGYDIEVSTMIERADGALFYDAGTSRWFGVDEEVKEWLAGSCRTTAFWLISFDEVAEGEWYTLKYRTLVKQGETVISDTTMLPFPRLSYEDIFRFEKWALHELDEMVELFKRKHGQPPAKMRPRSRLMTVLRLARQWIANKWKG